MIDDATIVAVDPQKDGSPRHLRARGPAAHRRRQIRNHGHAKIHHRAPRLRAFRRANRSHVVVPLLPLSRNQHDFRQARLQPRVRHMVPRQHLLRCRRRGLGGAQTAGLRAEEQYPHVLHADFGSCIATSCSPSTAARESRRTFCAIFKNFRRIRRRTPSKCTSIAAATPYFCPRPESSRK